MQDVNILCPDLGLKMSFPINYESGISLAISYLIASLNNIYFLNFISQDNESVQKTNSLPQKYL